MKVHILSPTMILVPQFEQHSVSRIGAVAHGILSEVEAGRIAAVFERCFYVDFSGRFVCFGCEDIANGPLNALVPAAMNRRRGGLTASDPVTVEGTTVRTENGVAFDFSRAHIWMPRTPEPVQDVETVSANLEKLLATVCPSAPATGLVGLLFAPSDAIQSDSLLRYASTPFDILKQWLAANLESGSRGDEMCPGDVCNLIGAGPGLTPSGDDLIAGCMVTLHRLAEHQTLARLAQCVGTEIAGRTNAISGAHLRSAMEGAAAETIITVIDELVSQRAIAPKIIQQRLNAQGATSGWDCLTGIVAVLECWQGTALRLKR